MNRCPLESFVVNIFLPAKSGFPECAKTLPFTRYGLPFVLWDYDIEKANRDKDRA